MMTGQCATGRAFLQSPAGNRQLRMSCQPLEPFAAMPPAAPDRRAASPVNVGHIPIPSRATLRPYTSRSLWYTTHSATFNNARSENVTMGLDAVVFCGCVEKDRLKSPHHFPHLLYIAPNGCPEIRSSSRTKIEQHDDWMRHACKHEDMMVGGDHLGNVSSIEFLQQALRRAVRSPGRDFPALWKKVIYSGAHCGDH